MNTPNLLMTVLLAALLTLAGCGGGNNSTIPNTNNDGDGTMTQTPAQRAAAAKTAVEAVTDTADDAKVTDADTKLAAARTAVNKVPVAQRAALSQQLGNLVGMLNEAKESRTTAMKAKNVATSKAMFAALAGPKDSDGSAQTNLTALNNIEQDFRLKATGTDGSKVLEVGLPQLEVNPVDGAGSMPLDDKDKALGTHKTKALDPVGAPRSVGKGSPWMVTDYRRTGLTNTPTGNEAPSTYSTVTDWARIYSNWKNMEVDAAKHFAGTDRPPNAGNHDAAAMTLPLKHDGDMATKEDIHIQSDGFPTAGKTDFDSPKDTETNVVSIQGTYQGAPGNYRCTSATAGDCTVELKVGIVENTKDDAYPLLEKWIFQYDEGAQVTVTDKTFYYFGCWVREDSDGGAFTADVTLNAIFGNTVGSPVVENAGVTGTINGFRLKGGSTDSGWSVELKRAAYGSGTTSNSLASARTVWSINGNPAKESG